MWTLKLLGSHSLDGYLGSKPEEALRIDREGGRQVEVQIAAPLLCSCVVLGKLLTFAEPHMNSGVGIIMLSWQDHHEESGSGELHGRHAAGAHEG